MHCNKNMAAILNGFNNNGTQWQNIGQSVKREYNLAVQLSVPIMQSMSLLSATLLFSLALPAGNGRTEPTGQSMRNCAAGITPEQSRICDEEASRQAVAGSQTTQLDGGWRLVKTSNPHGGPNAVSVMHLVNSARSDFGMAGLSLQCGPKAIEVVIVLLEPLSRYAHPAVVITAGSRRFEFEASVTQTGLALVLPQAASTLAADEWQKTTELSLQIETKPAPIKGVVSIDGLSGAWRSLTPHCATK